MLESVFQPGVSYDQQSLDTFEGSSGSALDQFFNFANNVVDAVTRRTVNGQTVDTIPPASRTVTQSDGIFALVVVGVVLAIAMSEA